MVKEQPDYLAYLLRLWREGEQYEPVWLASLESPQTRERTGFTSLDDLFDFLRQETSEASHPERIRKTPT